MSNLSNQPPQTYTPPSIRINRVYPELINLDSNIDPKYKFEIFYGKLDNLNLESVIVKSEFSIWNKDKLTRFEVTQKLSVWDAGDFWIVSLDKCLYKVPSHHLEISEDGNLIKSHVEELKSDAKIQPMPEPSGIIYALNHKYAEESKVEKPKKETSGFLDNWIKKNYNKP